MLHQQNPISSGLIRHSESISVHFRLKRFELDPLKHRKWQRFNGRGRTVHTVHSPWRFSWLVSKIMRSQPAPIRPARNPLVQDVESTKSRFWEIRVLGNRKCTNANEETSLPSNHRCLRPAAPPRVILVFCYLSDVNCSDLELSSRFLLNIAAVKKFRLCCVSSDWPRIGFKSKFYTYTNFQ